MNKETKQYPSSNHHCEHIMQYYRNNLKTKGVFCKVKLDK